jgi:hypothetical protein
MEGFMRNGLVLFLAALAAFAQTPAEQKPVRVEGRILDHAGQPLRGATVTFRGNLPPGTPPIVVISGVTSPTPRPTPPTYSATSADDGSFAIDAVLPGVYQVQATRQGYLTQTYGAATPESTRGTPLNIRAPLTGFTIALTRQGVIAGSVLDGSDGVQGVEVRAVRFGYSNGRRQMTVPAASTTDDTGSFRIPGLAPGRYYVFATARPAGSSPIDSGLSGMLRATELPVQRTALFATYYPSSTTQSAATMLEVTAGGEARADIRMRRDPVHTVRGRVTGVTGAPAGAMVVVMNAEDPPPPSPGIRIGGTQVPFVAATKADSEGRFELRNVPSGQHTLVAFGGTQVRMRIGTGTLGTSAGGVAADDGSMVTTQISVGGADIEGLQLALRPPGQVQGKVIVEGGKLTDLRSLTPAMLAASNTVVPEETLARINAVRSPTLVSAARISTSSDQPTVDAEGNFTIPNVTPGDYTLQLNQAPPGFHLKAVRFGGADTTHSPFTFAGGQSELQVVFAKGAGTLQGSVKDAGGEPAPGAQIALWPRTRDELLSTGSIRVATADAAGAFQIANLAPGDYLAAAFTPLPDAGIEQYRPFLDLFTSDATSVKITIDAAATADLKQIPADKVAREIPKLP